MRAFLCSITVVVAGCASIHHETSGRAPTRSLCQVSGEQISALVLWRPQWRADQKDVALREAAAQRGIEQYFASSGCYFEARVARAADLPAGAARDRVLFIVVRELGPVVTLLGSPALVEGGTEVVLDIRATAANGAILADFRSHWRNGGPWVIKGTATLEEDMASALRAALNP